MRIRRRVRPPLTPLTQSVPAKNHQYPKGEGRDCGVWSLVDLNIGWRKRWDEVSMVNAVGTRKNHMPRVLPADLDTVNPSLAVETFSNYLHTHLLIVIGSSPLCSTPSLRSVIRKFNMGASHTATATRGHFETGRPCESKTDHKPRKLFVGALARSGPKYNPLKPCETRRRNTSLQHGDNDTYISTVRAQPFSVFAQPNQSNPVQLMYNPTHMWPTL